MPHNHVKNKFIVNFYAEFHTFSPRKLWLFQKSNKKLNQIKCIFSIKAIVTDLSLQCYNFQIFFLKIKTFQKQNFITPDCAKWRFSPKPAVTSHSFHTSPLLPIQSTYKNLPDLSSVGVDRTSLDSFSCLGIIPLKKGYGSSQGMAECSTPSLSRVMINPLGSVLAKSMHSNTNCLNALSISGKWKTSIDENEDKFIIYKWDKSFDIDMGEYRIILILGMGFTTVIWIKPISANQRCKKLTLKIFKINLFHRYSGNLSKMN